MSADYSGQTVLITGASAGIGRSFANELHQRGAKIVLVARRKEVIEELANELNAKRSGSASVLPADLSNEGITQVEDFIKTNRIDILVNNAGRGSFGEFDSIALKEELEMVSLNISATLRLVHAVLPQMRARKSGAIISLSSIAAFQPIPYMATYAATKGFNFMHSLALRNELKGTGIKVLTVCPGPTATEFGGVARVPGTMTGGFRDSADEVARESLAALEQNGAFVVTGLRSKLMALSSRVLPAVFTTWLTGWYLKRILTLHRAT